MSVKILLKKISNSLSKPKWEPRQGLVYKSWFKGDSHFGKTATVKVLFENKEYDGTFSVNGESCEVRIGEGKWKYSLQKGRVELYNVRQLISPSQNVNFKKAIRHINSISTLGQNGFAGTEITYCAEVLDSKKVIVNDL